MDNIIELNGKKYRLVPIEEEDMIDDYSIPQVEVEREYPVIFFEDPKNKDIADNEIKDAKAKESEYRKKFMERKLTPGDFPDIKPGIYNEFLHQPPSSELDNLSSGAGYSAFFGPGVTF